METTIPIQQMTSSKISFNKVLLACGIVSSLYYAAMNIIVPFFYPGYSHMTYTISELSAIGAPTRQLWIWLGTAYIILYLAFGWGVLRVAGNNRPLRIAAILILIYGVLGSYWPPMHMRGEATNLSDTLHLVWGGIASLGMILIMSFSAAAFDKMFRIYSVATIILLLLFGTLMSFEAPQIPVNGPTPLIGFWERLMLGLYFFWIVIFSIKLINRETLAEKRN